MASTAHDVIENAMTQLYTRQDDHISDELDELFRSKMAESKIHQMLWKIDYAELVFITSATGSVSSILAISHINMRI